MPHKCEQWEFKKINRWTKNDLERKETILWLKNQLFRVDQQGKRSESDWNHVKNIGSFQIQIPILTTQTTQLREIV